VAEATASLPVALPTSRTGDDAERAAESVAVLDPPGEPVDDTASLIVRDKTHRATPMSSADALHEMELVGHDFFLFVDADSGLPSVVYRRHGYDYGVIRLATS
jgi:hypothetical protein